MDGEWRRIPSALIPHIGGDEHNFGAIDCKLRDNLPDLTIHYGEGGKSVTISARGYIMEEWDNDDKELSNILVPFFATGNGRSS